MWDSAGAPLPRHDLFSKEALGEFGRGAVLWTYVRDADAWRIADGPLMAEAELVEYLAKSSTETPIILQHRILNHPALARLSSGPLCTVRMMTCRPFGGAPEFLAALVRMPVENRSVDNYAPGRVGQSARRERDTWSRGGQTAA